jgi:hypothetical protein
MVKGSESGILGGLTFMPACEGFGANKAEKERAIPA